jgi:hypothetical protein
VTKRLLGVLACALISGRASSFELGVGLEGAGSATHVGNGLPSGKARGWGGAGGGLLFEQRFELRGAFVETWQDIQTPLQIETGGSSAAGYLPLNAGLRLGLAPGALQYYFGVLLQGLFLTSRPASGAGQLKGAAMGLGADLGIDLAILFLRAGLEARFTQVLTGLSPDNTQPAPGAVLLFQGLLSLRMTF